MTKTSYQDKPLKCTHNKLSTLRTRNTNHERTREKQNKLTLKIFPEDNYCTIIQIVNCCVDLNFCLISVIQSINICSLFARLLFLVPTLCNVNVKTDPTGLTFSKFSFNIVGQWCWNVLYGCYISACPSLSCKNMMTAHSSTGIYFLLNSLIITYRSTTYASSIT